MTPTINIDIGKLVEGYNCYMLLRLIKINGVKLKRINLYLTRDMGSLRAAIREMTGLDI